MPDLHQPKEFGKLRGRSRHVVRAGFVDIVEVSESLLAWLGVLGLIGWVVARCRYKE